jgi:hypothetical protein
MRHPARFSRKPIRRYAVVLAVIAAPLLLNLANLLTGDGGLHESVFGAEAPSAAPDHALLMAPDVERALPAAPRLPPDSFAPTTL